MFCHEASLTAQGISGGAAIPVKCRSWTCPNCYEMRRAKLIAEGIAGSPNRFITITCRRSQYPSPERAAQGIAQAWRTIVQRWRRLNKKNKCEYLCVFEEHKSGWPHLHILWRGNWLAWSWLKAQCTALLNSPHVYIEKIDQKTKAAAYVAKYCGKAAHRFGKAKRYWMTPGYKLPSGTDAPKDFPSCWTWERVPETTQAIRAEWQRQNRVTYELPPDAVAWGHWLYDQAVADRPRPLPLAERKAQKQLEKYQAIMAATRASAS